LKTTSNEISQNNVQKQQSKLLFNFQVLEKLINSQKITNQNVHHSMLHLMIAYELQHKLKQMMIISNLHPCISRAIDKSH